MNPGSRLAFALALLLTMLLASCGGAAGSKSPSAAETPPAKESAASQAGTTDPEGSTFVSYRYGYSIVLPAGWDANKALEDLKAGEIPSAVNPALDRYEPGPGCKEGQCGTDLSPSEVSLWAGAAPLRGDDLEAYASDMSKGIAAKFPPCGKPDSEDDTVLDGEPAVLLSWTCEFDASSGTSPIFVMNALAVHEDLGYLVGWMGPLGSEEESRRAFGRALDTFAFD